MKDRLNAALSIKELGIEDDSHKHAGHAGAREGLGHFTLTIWATEFETLNTIQRHRLIYDALGEMLTTDVHALKIVIAENRAP